jgi:hypothetical protein
MPKPGDFPVSPPEVPDTPPPQPDIPPASRPDEAPAIDEPTGIPAPPQQEPPTILPPHR